MVANAERAGSRCDGDSSALRLHDEISLRPSSNRPTSRTQEGWPLANPPGFSGIASGATDTTKRENARWTSQLSAPTQHLIKGSLNSTAQFGTGKWLIKRLSLERIQIRLRPKRYACCGLFLREREIKCQNARDRWLRSCSRTATVQKNVGTYPLICFGGVANERS
jgi:hypothetical protein